MSEFIYNGLIKTYAGACRIPNVNEEHIDMYLNDIWKLVDQINEKGLDLNIYILNSMVLAFCNAARTEDMVMKVLPLYEKYHIKPDENTYMHIMKHYLHKR